jgi:asparagine synthase (glutamine-hydrolysing)
MPTPDLRPAAGIVLSPRAGGDPAAGDPAGALGRLVGTEVRTVTDDVARSLSWGGLAHPTPGGAAQPLGLVAYGRDGALTPTEVATAVVGGAGGVLPPFAGAVRDGDAVLVRTDALGFRQVYARAGDETPGVASSAFALAPGTGLDLVSVAALSRLGWLVGERSLFAGVTVVPPGGAARVTRDGVALVPGPQPDGPQGRVPLDEAAKRAAAFLRGAMSSLMDEYPDAVLQLTGGQDSRTLLAAVPPSRRPRLRTMTLVAPGSGDAPIAAAIAARYGMEHRVADFAPLDEIGPDEAYAAVTQAALRLDCAADPVAYASLAYPEATLGDAVRVSGLGGEFARGFYYMGPMRDVPVTRQRAERLARWRAFPNESVDDGVLTPQFAAWSLETALAQVHAGLVRTGRRWWDATDEFYLGERMRRWAGTLATATAFDRMVLNPMLDERFLRLCRSVAPRDKRAARFLSRILVELDPELAALPMDGRPAPAVYASGGARRVAALGTIEARRIARKVRQRLTHGRRPAAGAEVLAGHVLDHWRADGSDLTALAREGIVDPAYLDRVVAGAVTPAPPTVGFLVNLVTALAVTGGSGHGRAAAAADGAPDGAGR